MTPQENLRRALLNDEFLDDAQEDRLFSPTGTDALRQNRNIALSAWMTQVSGQDINAGSPTWQQDKDALVQGYFKNPTASNVSDEEIHGLVRSHIQTTEEAATMAAESALIGAPLTQMMGGFSLPNISTRQGVSGRMPIYKQDALKRYNALSIKLAPYRNLVNQVSGELRKEMESEVPTTDKLESMAERLLSVNPEDRPLVLKAIGATGGKDAKERASYLSKIAGAMGRMAETMGGSVVSAMSQASMAETEASLIEAGQTEFAGRMAKESVRQRDFDLLTQQIRTVADQEIAPIKGDAWYSQLGIDVARMIPQSAVTIANPALGMAANWAYFENTIAGEAMLQDPNLTPQQARSIAGISAPINAAVETFTALIPFGRVKLPFVQKWLQSTSTSIPTAAARFGVRAAAGTAGEIVEEYAQSAAPLIAQKLLGALQKDMPAVDWENRMPKFADIAAQTWGPALVFSLVGAGSVSISEVNSGRALANDVDLMVAQGLAPAKAQSIATAAEANNWQQVDTLFREDFVKPGKATDTEKAEATQRFLAKIQAHQEVETINAKEAEKIGGVRIFRDDEGWNVELADGSIIKTDSADAARRYRDELYLTELDHEAESMIALSDDLVKAFPGTRLELREEVLEADSDGLTLRSLTTGKTTVIKDAKSLENLWREASAVGFQSGKRTAQAVLGDNFMEFGKSIARVFQRGRGSNDAPAAITAMHEVIEAAWKKGVMAGQWSVEGTRQIIATIVPTLEAGIANLGKETQSQELLWLENAKKAAAEGDEDLIREVFVEMAVRTWIGRDRDGNKTGLRPGTILRALNAAVLQESDPENITMGQKVIEWFKSIGAYLKGVIATANIIRSAERDGTIDDFTGFLDKVLGIETATREESEVKEDVQNMAFSLAPELKSFSLSPQLFLSEPYRVYEKKPGATYASPVDKVRESLAELTESPVMHETNLAGARKLLAMMMGRMGRTRLFVTNDPALALGQGGAGIKITFNPARLNGNEPNSLQNQNLKAVGSASREFIVEKFVKGAVQRVEGSKSAIAKLKAEIPLLSKFQESENGTLLERVAIEENGKPVGSTFSLAPIKQDRGGLSDDEFNQLSEKEQDSILRSADVGKARAILLKGLDFPQNNQYTRLTFEDEPSKSSKSDSLYYFVRAWLTDAETDRLFKKDADGFLEYDYQLEEAGYQIDDDGVYKGLEIRISDHPATASARTDADIELIVDDGRASRPSWYQKHPDAYRSFAAAASDIPRKAVKKLGVKNVTFSLSPTSGIDIVSDTLESWQDVFDKAAKRNPTRAMAIRDLAQQRINRLGEMWAADRWTAKGDKIRAVVEKRTKGSLDDEQAMREALRYQELLDAGMMNLTPDVLMAWSEGVGTLEGDPLISKMLHDNGRLMSKSTAARQGLPIKDLYDDAVWLPPQFYSGGMTISTAIVTFNDGSMGSYDAAKVPAEVKAAIEQGKATVKINKTRTPPTGGIMPDVMANNLGFDTASEMWAALDSSIKSHRNAKKGYAKAEAAVKGVEKQAREQAKAEAAAWRQEADDMQADDWSPRESLVRDMRVLNVALSAFPPEVRAKVTGGSMVKLAGLATERARYKAIQKALEKAIVETEVFMRKEYTGMLIKTLDKAAPIGKPGEVKKSKFIVTVQDEIDAINDMVGMDHDDVATAIAAAEAAIITAQTPEDADAKLTELNLLELFGGILDIKNTSSQEMASALEYLENIISQGRAARKIIDEARRERVKEMVSNAKREAYKGDSGPETTQAAKAKAAKESGKAMLKKFFNELSGFDAVLRDAFGPKSKTATEFSERFTLNSNRFEDVQNERRKRFRDFARELYRTKLGAKINQKLITLERIENASGVTYLKNRTVKTHKFTEEEAARIVADPKAFGFTEKDAAAISEEIQAIQETGGRRKVFIYEQVENEGDRTEIPLSQMDALYLSMALRQPGILEQQQRYGYDQETVDQLEKFLTDDAKRWRSWMQMEYDAAYNSANEVYMRMFNTRMPKIMFYAPLLKNHQGQQAVLDPLNTGISSNSANPGSIKTRKARTSSLRIESAFSVFWSHFNQMEYWNANAEYLRDVQSVMLNPEVREAVVSAHGEDGMATISAWVQLQMSRGVGKAALAVAGNKMIRNIKSAISMKALALNLSTTLKTIPSAFYSLGEIHMSKWPAALVSGMKHWDRLWKTNIIQRRLDIGGMPELRDLGSSALPMSWVNQGIRHGSYPTMYADGVFTTYSAAMAYGTSFDEAKRQDASDAMAHKYAEERTALIVSKTAQPENWTQKSLFENDASGAGTLYFMFTSDPRQKLALTGEALNQWRKGSATGEEAMRKFLAYWVIPGIMFQLANAIGRSLFKGDDDEWEVVDFATAALAGQLQGFAIIGSAVEIIFAAAIAAAAEKVTGEEVKKKPIWNSPKNPMDQAAQDLVKSIEKITENDVNDGPGKAWEIFKSSSFLLSPFSPAGAIPSTAERVMKDTTNLFYGADEK